MMGAQADGSRILVVDDEVRTVDADRSFLKSRNVDVTEVHPNDLMQVHLLNADLVLVDYKLDSWRARDAPTMPISLQPRSGVSLATVLRDHIRSLAEDQPTAVALHTAHLGDIRGPHLAPELSRHVVAGLHGLEWVFEKSDPSKLDQMAILAGAARRTPSSWPTEEYCATKLVEQLLGMDPDHISFARCWRSVVNCQVPLVALTSDGGGIRFLRWLLHQILPYPTFLIDEHWVAARLATSVEDLQGVINDGKSDLAKDLRSVSYTGVLAGFLGNRWWHGMLESYVWDLLQDVGDDRHNVREELSRRAGKLLSDTVPDPVVVLDPSTLRPKRTPASASEVVRIRPEYWPNFADPACLEIESVGDDRSLQAMVDLLDRGRLERGIDG